MSQLKSLEKNIVFSKKFHKILIDIFRSLFYKNNFKILKWKENLTKKNFKCKRTFLRVVNHKITIAKVIVWV